MNRDDIIRMAREARLVPTWLELCPKDEKALVRFAALVAAAEREACARVCDDEALRCEAAVQRAEPDEVSAIRSTAWKISVCAAAIRARSNT